MTALSKNARVAALPFPGHEAKVYTLGQPLILGEVATMLWLLVMGAKSQPLDAAAPSSAAG